MGGGGNSNSSGNNSRGKIPPRPKPASAPPEQQIAVNPSSNPVAVIEGGGGGMGAGAPGSNSGSTTTDLCWIEPFETTVSDPQPLAIRKVIDSQVLRVEAHGSSVWVVNSLGERCGTIHLHAAKILRCLQQKRRFGATVMQVNLAELRVEVHNA